MSHNSENMSLLTGTVRSTTLGSQDSNEKKLGTSGTTTTLPKCTTGFRNKTTEYCYAPYEKKPMFKYSLPISSSFSILPYPGVIFLNCETITRKNIDTLTEDGSMKPPAQPTPFHRRGIHNPRTLREVIA